jgi:hypothetical protein
MYDREDSLSSEGDDDETIKASLERLNISKSAKSEDESKILNFEMNMDKLYMIMENQTSKMLNNFESKFIYCLLIFYRYMRLCSFKVLKKKRNEKIDRNIKYVEDIVNNRIEFIKKRLEKVNNKFKSDLETIRLDLKE